MDNPPRVVMPGSKLERRRREPRRDPHEQARPQLSVVESEDDVVQVVLARRRRDELEHLGVFAGLALFHEDVAGAKDEDRIGVCGRLRFNRLGLMLYWRQSP